MPRDNMQPTTTDERSIPWSSAMDAGGRQSVLETPRQRENAVHGLQTMATLCAMAHNVSGLDAALMALKKASRSPQEFSDEVTEILRLQFCHMRDHKGARSPARIIETVELLLSKGGRVVLDGEDKSLATYMTGYESPRFVEIMAEALGKAAEEDWTVVENKTVLEEDNVVKETPLTDGNDTDDEIDGDADDGTPATSSTVEYSFTVVPVLSGSQLYAQFSGKGI